MKRPVADPDGSKRRLFKGILASFAEWGHMNGQCPCCLQAWPAPRPKAPQEQPYVTKRSVPEPDR